MKSVDNNHTLWVEKYRPQSINDTILPSRIKNVFIEMVNKKELSNMLLSGGAGIGKTTVAKALCKDLNCDYIVINASDERGLDVIRNTIKNFASSVSLEGNMKVVILDEADHLLPDTQAAMRNAIEGFTKSCKFIFTANYPERLIKPIHSRLPHIKFDPTNDELMGMQAQFFKRTIEILDNEGIRYDQKVLVNVVQRLYPDCRRILGEIQIYSRSGFVDEGIFSSIKDLNIKQLIDFIVNLDFKSARQWIEENSSSDTSGLYEKIYKQILKDKKYDSKYLPVIITILNEYQRYDNIVPSKEVHLASLCVQLMGEVEWNK